MVWVRNYRGFPRWLPGQITVKLGPLNYKVKVRGQTWKRHLDQYNCDIFQLRLLRTLTMTLLKFQVALHMRTPDQYLLLSVALQKDDIPTEIIRNLLTD